MAFEHGVVTQPYLTDSGAFKANAFVQRIREHGQQIRCCGTNAHHQSGFAERSIRTVSNMDRAMNNMPNAQNLCPADLLTGHTISCHCLQDLHMLAGKKLP